jgi:hypothetical protein
LAGQKICGQLEEEEAGGRTLFKQLPHRYEQKGLSSFLMPLATLLAFQEIECAFQFLLSNAERP